uniref:Uncharacterized protein n=1 Tax=Anopheles epiroticus TaxID=199890 RepID=A0A182PT72_9DIPT
MLRPYPQEYFPRGRQVVENHPGPNVDEEQPPSGHPVDFVLLQRMQNVNISLDQDEPAEFYRLRELPIDTGRPRPSSRRLTPPYVCTEEELYVRGHTAVWTRCVSRVATGVSQKTFTCDTPIRFAFFCPRQFIRPDTVAAHTPDTVETAICLIEKDTLHVFLEGGGTYKAMLQCPVSAVWMFPDGIMFERHATGPVGRQGHVPWPRLFTLTFPLEEMKPVMLLDDRTTCGFMEELDYRVVFACEHVPLVLVYDEANGKHILYKLRQSESEEIERMQRVVFSAEPGSSDATYSRMQTSEVGAGASNATGTGDTNKHTRSNLFGASGKQLHTSMTAPSWLDSFANNPFGEDVMAGLDRNGIGQERMEARSAPLEPQFCLEHVWTVGGQGRSGQSSSYDGEQATSAFLHTDLVGNTYVCFLQARACRLTLVQFSETVLNVLGVTSLPARSALSLERVNLIVLLDPTGRLILYSGCIAVGKLHVTGLPGGCFRATVPSKHFLPSAQRPQQGGTTGATSSTPGEAFPRRSTLLPNVPLADGKFEEELHQLSPVRPVTLTAGTPIVELRDATGSRFTLVLSNERLVRLALAPVAESHLVRCCQAVLRLVLPTPTVHEVLIHWYSTRNVPGSHAGFSAHQEWDLFRTLLCTMMGRPIGPPDGDDRERAGGTTPGTDPTDCPCADEPKKRRRGENSHGQPADWEFLVRHATDEPCETEQSGPTGSGLRRPYQKQELNSLYPYIPRILLALHLLYEDFKLNACRTDELRLLADFLYCLAADAELDAYRRHYLVDFPELYDRYRRHGRCAIDDPALFNRLGDTFVQPPAIFRYLEEMLAGRGGHKPFPYRAGINDLSCDMLTLVAYIYRVAPGQRWTRSHIRAVLSTEFFERQRNRPLCLQRFTDQEVAGRTSFEQVGDTVLAFLVERRYTRDQLDRLPMALRYLLLNFLEGCRTYLAHGLPVVYYRLLHRPELRAHGLCSGLGAWVPDVTELPASRNEPAVPQYERIAAWQTDLSEIEVVGAGFAGAGNTTGHGAATGGTSTATTAQKEDGVRPTGGGTRDEDGMGGLDEEILQLRFPDDRRIEDVRTFLDSSQRIRINLPQPATTPDHEFLEEQERRLYTLCLRTMALPIGRGMFTVCSTRPSETESVRIPRLCLSGRDVVRGTTIEIQQIEVPANMSLWPAFHNGVAAGLRICPDTPHITSTWITNNRQGGRSTLLAPGTDSSTEHGGFLLALGLTGHLRQLSLYSIFDYMLRSDEMVRLGLMLGLSVAYRGTADLATIRLLAVHVEALLPPTSVELDVSQNLQVAALLGVGLLYQGTAKRHMVEVLLQEIGRPPGPEMENYVERESYALTAGLALGLVTLGLGDCSSSLHDLALPDTLFYYMNGGNRRLMVGAQKEKYRLPSFQIREGPTVNVDVTAPGASLALGLMYFATGNEPIARLLDPPNTLYILQHLRPDLLQLRTIARHLIHWARIEPTCAWVDGQIPELLRQNVETAVDTIDHYLQYFIEQGVRLGKGSHQPPAPLARLIGSQVIENCTMMLLLALSLVLAGTGSLRVLRPIRMLRSRIGVPHVTYGSHMAIHMALGFLFLGSGRFTLSRSPAAIAALVCAIFPKFPTYSNDNRYHLQAFRHLYVLAIEPRIFLPRSIDTGRLCLCRIRYAPIGGTAVEVFAPCLLPELDTLAWVEVCDENFWHFRFDRRHNWQLLEIITSQLHSFIQDSHARWLFEPQNLLKLVGQPEVINATQTLLLQPEQPALRWPVEPAHHLSEETRHLIQLYGRLVADSVMGDRMHGLPLLLSLAQILQDDARRMHKSNDAWQLRLLHEALDKQAWPCHIPDARCLVSSTVLQSLLKRIWKKCDEQRYRYRPIIRQYLNVEDCYQANQGLVACELRGDPQEAVDPERRREQLLNLVKLIVLYDLPYDRLHLGGGE